MTIIMYVSAILAVVIILTIIGVLSRYRRCKPNQVLVVYGKTGGEKKSAKLYHGGAAESNPQIAIQYKMVNQWKEIAGEQVKAFEHINLGNITVFDGGQNSTGNFLNNVVKTVAPALGVIDQLPIADTLKKLKGDDKKINTMAQGYTWA